MGRGIVSLSDTAYPHPYAIFVRVLVAATAVLVFVGAMVTTTGSGLSVPDWPLSFGKLNPAMVGGVFFEHGHRLVASAVGFLVLISAFWAYYIHAVAAVRRLALAALGLVIFQGLLGGLTVLMRLPTSVSVAHGTIAQVFFCTVVALMWWTSPSFISAAGRLNEKQGRPLLLASLAMTVFVFTQLLIGATMRHMGAGLVIPDFPRSLGRWIPPLTSPYITINFTHRLMAVAVLAMTIVLCLRIFRFHRDEKPLLGLGGGLLALVCFQITLGAFTVWTQRSLVPTSLHVMNGALVLATAFSILLWSWRLNYSPREAVDEFLESPSTATKLGEVSKSDWMQLTKVRLVSMSVFTGLCGFWVGQASFSWAGAMVSFLGIAFLGAGSAMLNHVMEIETDALMGRTRNRPLPTGRVDIRLAERTGGALVAIGTLGIGLWDPLAGLLSFAAFFSYVFCYTPMKRFSPYCTVVGAIPGALPVLVGYVIRTGSLDLNGLILFAILFLWQLPHFIAIAWLCRDDYSKAGLQMVTVIDPEGRLASSQVLIYCLALLPVSMAPAFTGLSGQLYFYSALVLGLAYLYMGGALCLRKDGIAARKLLLTSVVYLPLLYGVMVVSS